jgi:hypothetical protein
LIAIAPTFFFRIVFLLRVGQVGPSDHFFFAGGWPMLSPNAPTAGALPFSRSLPEGGALEFFPWLGTAMHPATAFSRLTNLF